MTQPDGQSSEADDTEDPAQIVEIDTEELLTGDSVVARFVRKNVGKTRSRKEFLAEREKAREAESAAGSEAEG